MKIIVELTEKEKENLFCALGENERHAVDIYCLIREFIDEELSDEIDKVTFEIMEKFKNRG